MFVLVLLIPFLFMFMRKHVHVISVIQFLCCHLEISLLLWRCHSFTSTLPFSHCTCHCSTIP